MAPTMTYVDTSALVALFTGEPRGDALLSWLARHPLLDYCISDWVIAEFASALAIKQRRGDIDDGGLAEVWLAFDDACDTLLSVERVQAEDFGHAAAMCLQPASGLCSGSSLHLAVASRLACKSVVSFDETLNRNAKASGLAVIAP